MHKKCGRVNIYNFIRMSHTEPTRFIQDDHDTIREQIITVKQYGFPGTAQIYAIAAPYKRLPVVYVVFFKYKVYRGKG